MSKSQAHIDDLELHLESWVEHQLITGEQARRISAVERKSDSDVASRVPPTRPDASGGGAITVVSAPLVAGMRSPSLVTEALGYVGGILILVATAIIAGRYFSGLGPIGRVGVAGAAALALVGSGGLVRPAPARAAAGRLRSVLWLLSVAAVAFFVSLLADEVLGWTGEEVSFAAAAAAAAVGLELWRRHRWFLQQVAVVAALAVALASGVAAFLADGDVAPSGVAVWGLGGVWLMLGWGRHLRPRYATDLLGGAAVTMGALLAMDHDWGAALALASAASLVIVGVRLRGLVLLSVGSLAMLLVVPGVMQRYFPETVAAPLAVLGAGIVLVVAALVTTRRRQTGERSEPTPLPGVGTTSIVGFALAVTCAVLVLSLI